MISALASGASTVEQALGTNVIFAINADQDITIRFGLPGFATAAGTGDYRIPANSQNVYDVGNHYTSFKCYNLSATPTNIYIQFLSKF